MGSSLPFSLKEDPVRCAKVCDKSWVILMRLPVAVWVQKMMKTLFDVESIS